MRGPDIVPIQAVGWVLVLKHLQKILCGRKLELRPFSTAGRSNSEEEIRKTLPTNQRRSSGDYHFHGTQSEEKESSIKNPNSKTI